VIGETTYTRLCQLMKFQRFEGNFTSHQVSVLGVVVDFDDAALNNCIISDLTIPRTVQLREHTRTFNLQKGDCVLLRYFTVCNQRNGLPYLCQIKDEDHCGTFCIWRSTEGTLSCVLCQSRFEDYVLDEMKRLRYGIQIVANDLNNVLYKRATHPKTH
jgi:hypothetical protein